MLTAAEAAAIPAADRWMNPPEVAAMLGVDQGKVTGWIRAGLLIAVNVSNGSKKPIWRISPAELTAFLERRRSRPAAAPASEQPRRRPRRRPKHVIKFF